MFHPPEKFRIDGEHGAPYGAFKVMRLPLGRSLTVIASNDDGWEHVSVSRPSRCPTWDEMCEVKELFWDDEDMVIQYHPPKSQYINCHPHCLHMWKPTEVELPKPPSWMVGV